MTEETIDDVKQAYALLFKAHGKLREERDALLDKVRDYGGRMTDEHSSTLAELDEAIASNDLPSVGTEDARSELPEEVCAAISEFGRACMFSSHSVAVHSFAPLHEVIRNYAANLVSERDELASRVRELEAEVLDQCRLNGMGAERESALMGRVRELEGERDQALRNRDMWKGQCERQAEQLTALRVHPHASEAITWTPETGYVYADDALTNTPESKP